MKTRKVPFFGAKREDIVPVKNDEVYHTSENT